MKSDNNRPVVSFRHKDESAAIPDSAGDRGTDGHQRKARSYQLHSYPLSGDDDFWHPCFNGTLPKSCALFHFCTK